MPPYASLKPAAASMRWLRRTCIALAVVFFTATLFAAPRSTPSRPASSAIKKSAPAPKAERPTQLGGIAYLDAIEFAKKLGLKATWLKKNERLALTDKDTRIELETDSREISVNGVRVFMGEGARLQNGRLRISKIDADRLLAPLIKPGAGVSRIPPLRVIALDAGHGGRDPGKENRSLKVNEKTFTLDVAQRLEKLIEAQGYKVVQTRTKDVYVELGERAEIATRAGADLFISIHFNSVGGDTQRVSGTETYTMTPQFQRSTIDNTRDAGDAIANPGNGNDHWNALAGYHLHRALLNDLKTFDRGLKRGRLAVLRLATCPAVLVEAGYLSNNAEAKKIATAAYRQQIAEALADGVKAYAAGLTTAR